MTQLLTSAEMRIYVALGGLKQTMMNLEGGSPEYSHGKIPGRLRTLTLMRLKMRFSQTQRV
jgi:hypothetical protein